MFGFKRTIQFQKISKIEIIIEEIYSKQASIFIGTGKLFTLSIHREKNLCTLNITEK